MTDPIPVPSPPSYATATLHLTIDPTEHARRETQGLRHIGAAQLHLLPILMTLPAGLPVPLSGFTDSQRRVLRRAPAGILDLTDDHVTRQAIRPCRVQLATIHAPCTRDSISRAASYAPFCTRAVVTPLHPRRKYLLSEADFYGVGVLLDTGTGSRETLVTPEPWRPKRSTPAGWLFAENAYRSFLRHRPTGTALAATTQPGEEAHG